MTISSMFFSSASDNKKSSSDDTQQNRRTDQRRCSTGSTSGGASRKLYLDSNMDTDTICDYLDIAKSKLGAGGNVYHKDDESEHCTTVTLDEVFVSSTVAVSMIELFQHYTASFRQLDRLHIEFCEGSRDGNVSLIATSALTLNCVRHMFIASDDIVQQSKMLCPFGTLLRINTSLTSLWLLVPLSKAAAYYIGTGLAENNTLEKLSVSGCNFDVQNENRRNRKTIDDTQKTQSLNDNDSVITSAAPKPASSKSDTVTSESSQHPNATVSAAALVLADGLKLNSHLKSMDISCCYLDDMTMSVLLRGLQCHPTIESLALSGNYCRKNSIQVLAEMLEYKYTNIRSIDLREQIRSKSSDDGNDENDDEDDNDDSAVAYVATAFDVSRLAQSLRFNDTLEILKLSSNGLADDQVLELATALNNNSTLRELDLQWNCITDVGVNYFTDSLKGYDNDTGLQVLLLGGNCIGRDGVNVLDQLGDDDESICTFR